MNRIVACGLLVLSFVLGGFVVAAFNARADSAAQFVPDCNRVGELVMAGLLSMPEHGVPAPRKATGLQARQSFAQGIMAFQACVTQKGGGGQ